MIESTHRSGSGEEMAHSDSGHDLTAVPTLDSLEEQPIISELPVQNLKAIERVSAPPGAPHNSHSDNNINMPARILVRRVHIFQMYTYLVVRVCLGN